MFEIKKAPEIVSGEILLNEFGPLCSIHKRKTRPIIIVGIHKFYCPDCEEEKYLENLERFFGVAIKA